MKQDRVDGYMVAVSPIHHGGDENAGTTALVRRMTYICHGKRLEVPIISGNSIRGYLRRLVMRDMMDRLDMQFSNLKVYHTLFAGGTLTDNTSDQGKINLEFRRQVRDAIPPISLFGTAIGNQMFEGKLKCGIAVPVCRELAHLMPSVDEGSVPAIKDASELTSFNELLGHDFLTRRDDIRDDREEGERALQMKADLEVIVPGTVFVQRNAIHDASDVELGVFGRAMELWNERPYVGGKSGTGYGAVELHYDLPPSEPWLKWLSEHGDEVGTMIGELESIV